MAEKNPGKARGRGRGRSRPTEPDPRPPLQSTIDFLREEPDVSQPTPEQFSNATSVAEPTAPSVTENTSTDDNMDRDTSKTTAADGKSPPIVAELKEKVKCGVRVALNPQSPEFLPSTTTFQLTKLSVDAEPFTLSNGPSTELELAPPDTLILSNPLPITTKQAQSSTVNTGSKLNPNSPEFNPLGLNVAAPVFVPRVPLPVTMRNGEGQVESLPTKVGDEVLSFGPVDIVRGFTPVAVVGGDLENEPIIKTAAEMLVKGAMYVASFDQLEIKLQSTIATLPLSDEVLANLAEMIVHWGVSEPYFRYTACRMCEILCEEEKVNAFHRQLVRRLGSWYDKQKYESEEEKYCYINFALFCAEIFSRIKVGGNPMAVVANKVFKFVETLLTLKTDEMVIGACNILKLTGALLEQCDKSGSMDKMDKVMEDLKMLALDESLSRSCTDVLIRVIQQRARNWGESVGVATIPFPSLESPSTKGVKQLNIDAKPFVPSGDFQIQQPVLNVEEWNEFETDYGDATDEGVVYDFPDGGFDEDGLDPDIELEMEAFIDEIEEHLLMQDFDPEIQTELNSSRQ